MKFNKKELGVLLKAVKIMQSGEELLGIDINKKIVDALIDKLSKEIDTKSVKRINKEIVSLIEEARKDDQFVDYERRNDFDREFGPSYAYSDTLRILNQAIENNKVIEIDYYSANQGSFTKRKVKPKDIERRSGVPYLNAFCYLRNDDRVFKLSRIKDIKIVKRDKK